MGKSIIRKWHGRMGAQVGRRDGMGSGLFGLGRRLGLPLLTGFGHWAFVDFLNFLF